MAKRSVPVIINEPVAGTSGTEGRQVAVAIDANREVIVKLKSDCDYAKRLDVRVDRRRWMFDVEDELAKLIETYRNEQPTAVAVPAWMESLLRHVGLEGLDA